MGTWWFLDFKDVKDPASDGDAPENTGTYK
jgi:hypothetical protein